MSGLACRELRRLRGLPWALLVLAAVPVWSQTGESVIDTVHNLSVSGPGEIRATSEREVCKFCHVPHNALLPVPLWGHALSDATYRVPDIADRKSGGRVPAPQPDGSSRLCLSCHDGTVALGDLGPGRRAIEMRGASRLDPERGAALGTDLSGSHPVSIVYPEDEPKGLETSSDMGLNPRSLVATDVAVALDHESKVQCTSCHDPHADRFHKPGEVPRFWVKPTVEEVCLTCHALR